MLFFNFIILLLDPDPDPDPDPKNFGSGSGPDPKKLDPLHPYFMYRSRVQFTVQYVVCTVS